jgi:hypothetical protein
MLSLQRWITQTLPVVEDKRKSKESRTFRKLHDIHIRYVTCLEIFIRAATLLGGRQSRLVNAKCGEGIIAPGSQCGPLSRDCAKRVGRLDREGKSFFIEGLSCHSRTI